MFELHEQGMKIDCSMIILFKASPTSPNFYAKSAKAHHSTMHCFVKAHGMVYQLGTPISHQKPEEVGAESGECSK
jgi:hypothetical protein